MFAKFLGDFAFSSLVEKKSVSFCDFDPNPWHWVPLLMESIRFVSQ